ncbi:hypothetical protein ABL78_0355 [Leptomonas seymouri]|uniref:Uncharacterized protein n=1 Tax=Leptomonas seymouri TaxID=5684 RepID=A0A0N1IMK9_LEPSE|nr:hypothetical protein ABL78_0355 [Leptomonas seymouri]|eukprot:KPI90595.1 hypothetical protein ABL78_0355 [Leptomonas seymouri]
MSYESDCLVRLSAAAQDMQLTVEFLHCMSELLQTVTDSVESVRVASTHLPSTDPPPGLLKEQKDTLVTQADEAVDTHVREMVSSTLDHEIACMPTDQFWRVWGANSKADALFHSSGMSTLFRAFENTVAERIAHSYTPRLFRLQEKVQRVGDFVEREGGRVLMAHDVEAMYGQWKTDAVAVLSQAAHAWLRQAGDGEEKPKTTAPAALFGTRDSASQLWVNLEADFEAVAASMLVESESCDRRSEETICEGRLQQQQRRIWQLLREIVKSICGDSSPLSSPTRETCVKARSVA